jgi:hypothetical protein
MTMKIADAAPDEAQLVEISLQLSEILAESSMDASPPALALDATYLEVARTMLATLTESVAASTSGKLGLTRQQLETYLDFDPDFLDTAKDMLRDFIGKTEASRNR